MYICVDTTGGTNQTPCGGGSPSVTNVLDGNWHHVVFILDNGNCTSYKDDVAGASGTYTAGTGFGNTNDFQMNSGNNDHNQTYTVDDVRIYNRALSTTEIQHLYQLGASANHAVNTSLATSNTLSTSNGGLVGWWTFDGKNMLQNVTDSSGNGNTGFMENFSSTSSALTLGKIGQALSFTSNANPGAIVDVTNQTPFNFETTTPFSTSFWVRRTNDPPVTALVVDKYTAGNLTTGYGVGLDDSAGDFCGGAQKDSIFFHLAINNPALNYLVVCSPGSTIPPDRIWHHIVTTYNGSGLAAGVIIYKDTVVQSQATTHPFPAGSTGSALNSVDLGIGGQPNTNDSVDGTLDDVRIYNRVLSPAEVKRLYDLAPHP